MVADSRMRKIASVFDVFFLKSSEMASRHSFPSFPSLKGFTYIYIHLYTRLTSHATCFNSDIWLPL